MKKYLLFLGTLLALATAFGQNGEPATLFDGGQGSKLGFMIAPSYGFTRMDEVGVSLAGVRGGLVLGDRFTAGGFFHLSVNDFVPVSEIEPNLYMDYRAGGGLLEYTLFSDRLFHLTIPLLIGVGEVEMDSESGSPGLGESNFFLLEPAALLEVNLHKNVRLNLGAAYRFIGDMTYRNLDQRDLAGLTGQVGLKFGMFRR